MTLDIGCGSRPKGDVNVDLLVEDSDPIKTNLLQRRNLIISDVYVPNFIVADARFLPFRDNAFSKCFCFHVIEHISEDLKVYDEIGRVTREDVEIRVPFGIWEDLFSLLLWWKHLNSWRKIHHLRSYSKRMFKRSLVKVFDEKEVSVSYGFISFWRSIHFELKRKTRFPFPFPFELVANIKLVM